MDPRGTPTSAVLDRLHGIVRADPGTHVQALARRTGLSWTACRHHVRRLERQGRVAARRVGNRLCLFDRTGGRNRRTREQALLQDPYTLRVARAVLGRPGSPQWQVADAADLAVTPVHRRAVALQAAGLMHRVPDGRSVRLYPSRRLQQAVAALEAQAPLAAASEAPWGTSMDAGAAMEASA